MTAFGDGWNHHDVDFLMTFMTDDCVFAITGRVVCGTRYEVARAGARPSRWCFNILPDAHFGEARHFIAGDRWVSEWVFTGTTTDGKKIEVNGCDIFTFRNRQDRHQGGASRAPSRSSNSVQRDASIARAASTTLGSKRVPDSSLTTASASGSGRAGRYGRS